MFYGILNEFFFRKAVKVNFIKSGVKIVGTEVKIIIYENKDKADDIKRYKDEVKADAPIINKYQDEIYDKSIKILTKTMNKYYDGFSEANIEITKKDVVFKKCEYAPKYRTYTLEVEYKDKEDFGYAEVITDCEIKVNEDNVNITTHITEY
jgi:hypothetical protein